MGKKPKFEFVSENVNQRSYFPFYDYEYALDVSEMSKLMPNVKPLEDGLKQSYKWFKDNRGEVLRKKLFEFIESELRG